MPRSAGHARSAWRPPRLSDAAAPALPAAPHPALASPSSRAPPCAASPTCSNPSGWRRWSG
eukprot:2221454-Alexandrium_andersonii.AAC.2